MIWFYKLQYSGLLFQICAFKLVIKVDVYKSPNVLHFLIYQYRCTYKAVICLVCCQLLTVLISRYDLWYYFSVRIFHNFENVFYMKHAPFRYQSRLLITNILNGHPCISLLELVPSSFSMFKLYHCKTWWQKYVVP